VKVAYVDTSYLVAVAFGEPGGKDAAAHLKTFDRLFSSNLLEAELRSALAREAVKDDGGTLAAWITWVFPNRRLTGEFEEILRNGPLRGADLWHLACALFLAPAPQEMSFLSLDKPQRRIAARLGFRDA
jgi:predicted nucleic acid-binding protein